MKTHVRLYYYCFLCMFMCTQAFGQCPFAITHDADLLSFTCTEVTTGVWDLDVAIVDDGAPTVTIIANDLIGGGSPAIRNLVFDLTDNTGTGPFVTASVTGPTLDPENLAGLDSLSITTTTGGELYLTDVIVGGDLGTLEAQKLNSLRVTGDVTGDINILELGGFFSGAIGTLDIDGDLLGSIGFASNDLGTRIDTILVGGDIGTPSSQVSISVSTTIGLISCDNLYADVATLHNGTIRRIETTGLLRGNIHSSRIKVISQGSGLPGVFIGGGDYKNDLTCTIELAGDIVIPGDLTGSLQLANIPSGNSVAIGGDLDSTASIDILGDLDGTLDVSGEMGGVTTIRNDLTGTIDTATAGLAGQIIVNAANNGSLWLGDVIIDTTTLGPTQVQPFLAPYYEEPSTNLGGGAVGLVPFNFHPIDSEPDHDSVATAAPSSVEVHHYGPVSIGSGTGVKVYEGSIAIGFSSVGEVYLCYAGPSGNF